MVCPACEGDGIERCTNPDHGFFQELIFTDMGRIGCPCCGHDEKHRIMGSKCPDCNGTGIIEGAKNTEQPDTDFLNMNTGEFSIGGLYRPPHIAKPNSGTD